MAKGSLWTFGACLLVAVVVAAIGTADAGFPIDVNYNFTQIVNHRGYPCETHHVTTEDGYINTLFRIPYGRNNKNNAARPPVILQHGLLDSAFTWILNMPDQSLSYLLADAGYDVWMGNSRGNIYSTDHVNMTNSDPRYWQFSWDEMAKYDLPANIAFIKNATGYSRIAYVGHSQGTIQMFAALTTQPNLHESLTTFIGFGPVAYVAHMESLPFKLLAKFDVDDWVKYFGFLDFLPEVNKTRDPLVWYLFEVFCYECASCCANGIELICGQHQGAFNDSRMPVVVTHEPGGTSVKNMQHWAQGVRSGKFQMFDYGTQENMQRYNQATPPQYKLGSISPDLSIALYSGGQDILADPEDVKTLIAELPKPEGKFYWQYISDYAHLDFAWAIDARTQMYQTVIGQIQMSFNH